MEKSNLYNAWNMNHVARASESPMARASSAGGMFRTMFKRQASDVSEPASGIVQKFEPVLMVSIMSAKDLPIVADHRDTHGRVILFVDEKQVCRRGTW